MIGWWRFSISSKTNISLRRIDCQLLCLWFSNIFVKAFKSLLLLSILLLLLTIAVLLIIPEFNSGKVNISTVLRTLHVFFSFNIPITLLVWYSYAIYSTLLYNNCAIWREGGRERDRDICIKIALLTTCSCFYFLFY